MRETNDKQFENSPDSLGALTGFRRPRQAFADRAEGSDCGLGGLLSHPPVPLESVGRVAKGGNDEPYRGAGNLLGVYLVGRTRGQVTSNPLVMAPVLSIRSPIRVPTYIKVLLPRV